MKRLEIKWGLRVLERSSIEAYCGNVGRWREYIQSSWFKKCTNINVEGGRVRGRPRKIWSKVRQQDLRANGSDSGCKRQRNLENNHQINLAN